MRLIFLGLLLLLGLVAGGAIFAAGQDENYDTDGDGYLSYSEIQIAVADYLDGEISESQMLKLQLIHEYDFPVERINGKPSPSPTATLTPGPTPTTRFLPTPTPTATPPPPTTECYGTRYWEDGHTYLGYSWLPASRVYKQPMYVSVVNPRDAWTYGLIWEWRARDSEARFLVHSSGEYEVQWDTREGDLYTLGHGELPDWVPFNHEEGQYNRIGVRTILDEDAYLGYVIAFDVNGVHVLNLTPRPSDIDDSWRSRDPKFQQGLTASPNADWRDWKDCN